MRSDGFVHLLGHIQGHVPTPTEIPPSREGDGYEKLGKKRILCGVGRHFFVFFDGKIRGAGKDEIVLMMETREMDGLGGLEQELYVGVGL